MKKKIVLITTGQPSTNPRIVKEADALHAIGYDVTLLYCFFINWATESDRVILEKVSWKYKMVGGCPHNQKSAFLFTRLRYKLALLFSRYIGTSFCVFERSQARAYDELLQETVNIKADWYIGHNLGALAVAVRAAKFHGAKAGFDFEDYHRGEIVRGEKYTLQRIRYLENKYLPFLNYYSTASKLITEAVKKDHPFFKGTVITLNNCFPLKQQPLFIHKNPKDETLQLFWFSQTIGINRGLETLIEAVEFLNDPSIHVTLAGRCNKDMLAYIKLHSGAMFSNIHLAGIIQPEKLPEFASQFDVGLALETAFSVNNNIALSNKIFTYLLAGNAIILSNTTMQLAFNKVHAVGEIFAINDMSNLVEKIKYYKEKQVLNAQKRYNYLLATKQLNWDAESKNLLDVMK
ncbi:MAG: hypothetical protein JWP81_1948 [Ferruginibacter sp.]|nr:hypothetical protein [Ferruginibacter sp.]